MSAANNLVDGDTNDKWDIFVYGRAAPEPIPFSKLVPANGATNQPFSPTLAWEANTDAISYEYCFSAASDNCDLGDWINVSLDTSVELSDLAANATHYWQVRAITLNGLTEADDSLWWSFTTQPFTLYLPLAFNEMPQVSDFEPN